MTHRIALRARANQHFVYSGQSILVTNLDGCVTGSGTEGFYVENTRLLCRDVWTADGRSLMTIAASPVGGDRFLAYCEVPQSPGISEHAVSVEITRVVGAGMRTELRIENYDVRETVSFTLALHLAADFADMEETQRGTRQQCAAVETMWNAARSELVFRYTHPDLDRAVAVRVEETPVPAGYADGALLFPLVLPPHAPHTLAIATEPLFDGERRTMPRDSSDDASSLAGLCERLRAEAPSLVTSNATVARAWRTAVDDLASLPLGLDAGPAAPIAGIPLYQQFFGRDTLTIGWQAAPVLPEMLGDALRVTAAMQGTVFDNWRDEEPGRIIHQARSGPLSLLNIDPFARYYGDYSAPQDFLVMVGQYLAWTDDRETIRALLPAARRVLDWLEQYGDRDGDGFLEYLTRSRKGLKNQGWKDSGDGIVDEHGAIVPNPIATSEMQAYWYVGMQQVALAFLAVGEWREALALARKARDLQRRFDRAFWMEEEGFYALGLDPDKRQIRSIASNTGHLLACGIVPREKAHRVARRLMAPDMFSGWGVRTLSSDHPAYNPFSYHLGSVWPVENAAFAFGFAQYGCWSELSRLAEAMFASTELFVEHRLPEVLGGISRDAAHPHPGIYPGANEPQGWSDSAIILLVQALLGMRPVAPLGLLIVDPHLPPWLPDLRLENLRIGGSRLDLHVRRMRNGTTRYRVRRRAGHVRVIRQPAPDAPKTSLGGRAIAALRSLPHS